MPGEQIRVPKELSFAASMPPAALRIYNMLKPSGVATLAMQIDRPTPGGAITVSGKIHILDGEFTYEDFPYPVRKVSGLIAFDQDPKIGLQNRRA